VVSWGQVGRFSMLDFVVGGLVAAGLLIYLAVALMRAEQL